MAVARGFVVALGGDSITLSTDKPLPPQFGGDLRQGGVPGGRNRRPDTAEGTQLPWRLDKDEVASVFLRLRRNLMGDTLSLTPRTNPHLILPFPEVPECSHR